MTRESRDPRIRSFKNSRGMLAPRTGRPEASPPRPDSRGQLRVGGSFITVARAAIGQPSQPDSGVGGDSCHWRGPADALNAPLGEVPEAPHRGLRSAGYLPTSSGEVVMSTPASSVARSKQRRLRGHGAKSQGGSAWWK